MAIAIIPRKRIYTRKGFVELVAWRVPKTEDHLEGIKYSFVYIRDRKRVIAFDNYNKEGHHKHYFDKKEFYDFKDIKKTARKLMELVKEHESKGNKSKD